MLSDTLRLREALESRNTRFDLHVFRGETHAFNVLLWREAARAHWDALFSFLAEYLEPHEVLIRKPAQNPKYVSLAQMIAD